MKRLLYILFFLPYVLFGQLTGGIGGGFISSSGDKEVYQFCTDDEDFDGYVWIEKTAKTQVCFDDPLRENTVACPDYYVCPQEFSECKEWALLGVFIDNTQWGCSGTGEITFDNQDGTQTKVQITNGSPGGCSNQMFDWTSAFSAAYPEAVIEPRCNLPNGCGGLLPPSSDFNPVLMQWRYVNWSFCPKTDHYPIKATITDHSTASRIGRIMDLEFDQSPIKEGYICYSCGEGGTLYYNDGIEVPPADLPICTYSCADASSIPPPAENPCNFSLEESGCDNMGTPDDLTDDVAEIIRRYVTCEDGVTAVEYYITDPNDPQSLIDYTIVGQWSGLCDGQPTELPEPEVDCEVDGMFKLYSYETTGTLRNREWDIGSREINNQTVAFANTVLDGFDYENEPTTVDGDWNTLAVNDTNNDSGTMDLQIIEGFILVEDAVDVRWIGSSLGYIKVELGECCGALQTIIEGASGDGTANPTSSATFPVGRHKIKITNLDDFTNTSRGFQYSSDGGFTWVTSTLPSFIKLSRNKPSENCKNIKSCTSGVYVDLRGDKIDLEDCYECSLSCDAVQSVVSESSTVTGMYQYCHDGQPVVYCIDGKAITYYQNGEILENPNFHDCTCPNGLPEDACSVLNDAEPGDSFLVDCELSCSSGSTITVYNQDGSISCTATITGIGISGGQTKLALDPDDGCAVNTSQLVTCN